MTKDVEKPKVLNATFNSAFTRKTSLQESQASETRGQVWSKKDLPKKDLPLVDEEHLNMGPDRKHPWVLKVVADVTVRPLFIIFESTWRLGEVPEK